jgi:ATP-binding cassette subfamily B protein
MSTETSRKAGLPFAGYPSELREGIEKILDKEPEHPDPNEAFGQIVVDTAPFTLRSFLAPLKWFFAAGVLLVIVETLALQVGPLLVQRGIDSGIREGDVGVVTNMALLYLGAIAMSNVVSYVRIRFTGEVGESLMYRLRVRVFSHLQRLSLEFYTGEKAGRLMTRMTSDIEALTQLFHDGLINMAVQLFTLVMISIFLVVLNPALAAITLLAVVPITMALTIWFRNASARGYDVVRDRIAELLADLQENLSGIRLVASHNRRRHNMIRHRNVVGAYRDANFEVVSAATKYAPAVEMLGIGAQAVILFAGGNMVRNGSMTIGELTAFLLFVNRFFAPMQALVQLYNGYQSGQAAVAKLRDLLGTTPSVPEAPGASALPALEGDIELVDVTFGYDPSQPVLSSVSLRVPAGESLAVVGPTGAGKSTIAKLVSRFYDPQSGEVRLDGHDLRGVTLHSLRSQLGVVPQEPFLFNGSIRDNIAFAVPDATDDDIAEACRVVGLDDLVERLPMGVDTPVHERGASLSSGERQLLALARAFLAKPRVLILDEATSNLDLQSEIKIEGALDVLLEGRTAIVVAHRLATAMRADRIAVVDNGAIVELDSHDNLVAMGGQYAEMYRIYQDHLTGK